MALFSDHGFFLWLAVLAVPAIVLGVRERPIKYYGLLVSLFFVWMAMGSNIMALINLSGFILFEYAIIRLYLHLRLTKGRSSIQYWIFLLLSLAPLSLYKVLSVTGNPYKLFGFLGISYMTFKGTQIVIEIYDGLIKEVRFLDLLYLLIFFPAITSGPIDRSRRFNEDLERKIPREEYLGMVGEGLFKVLQGMVYKMIIAAIFYSLMTRVASGDGFTDILLYMYLYGFYLFFDFAGYSLMAIGAGMFFGIRTPDNFNMPFISKDINEFWDRWHITLSHWFRDYIFSRVTMDMVRSKKFKNKLTIASIAFLINMGIMGIWHGLQANYIIYGLYHGVLLMLFEIIRKKSKFYKKNKKNKCFIAVEWCITFHLVMFGFLIFSGRLNTLS